MGAPRQAKVRNGGGGAGRVHLLRPRQGCAKQLLHSGSRSPAARLPVKPATPASCAPLIPPGSIRFRGDSRWLGMSLAAARPSDAGGAAGDVLLATTQSHRLFCLSTGLVAWG